MLIGSWLDCLIDIDRATEFTGDDVDLYSKLIDLGREYERLLILVPTITSAALSIYVQEVAAVATVPKQLNYYKPEAAAHVAWATTAGTGAIAISCESLGGYRYVRIYSGANQAADRTLRICGVRS